jgi:hypothetical protein
MKKSLDPAIGQVPVEDNDEDDVFLNMTNQLFFVTKVLCVFLILLNVI